MLRLQLNNVDVLAVLCMRFRSTWRPTPTAAASVEQTAQQLPTLRLCSATKGHARSTVRLELPTATLTSVMAAKQLLVPAGLLVVLRQCARTLSHPSTAKGSVTVAFVNKGSARRALETATVTQLMGVR
jgi:hypothetical protein